jgi:hypothetical protein
VETIRAKAIRAGAEASIAILPTGKVRPSLIFTN